MKKGLVPGSFDPITLGHIRIIERAAKLFDSVVVCVMVNEEKKYLFSVSERVQMIEQAVAHLPNVSVDSWDGMLWQYAHDHDICAVIKGIRNSKDAEYEILQAAFNSEKYPQAQTIFIPAPDGMQSISSSMVKKLALMGRDLTDAVTDNVKIKLIEKYGESRI